MGKYAKWLGGTLGWAFGGPIGAVLGFALGSIYDGASGDLITWQGEQPERSRARPQTTRADFEASLLVLTAAVMKADDTVMAERAMERSRGFLMSVKSWLGAPK